eukprot:gene346-2621_t
MHSSYWIYRRMLRIYWTHRMTESTVATGLAGSAWSVGLTRLAYAPGTPAACPHTTAAAAACELLPPAATVMDE